MGINVRGGAAGAGLPNMTRSGPAQRPFSILVDLTENLSKVLQDTDTNIKNEYHYFVIVGLASHTRRSSAVRQGPVWPGVSAWGMIRPRFAEGKGTGPWQRSSSVAP
jgi:hypothetical protein